MNPNSSLHSTTRSLRSFQSLQAQPHLSKPQSLFNEAYQNQNYPLAPKVKAAISVYKGRKLSYIYYGLRLMTLAIISFHFLVDVKNYLQMCRRSY
ncbi:hypothetical protein ACET3Z_001559 [Daucus carota]